MAHFHLTPEQTVELFFLAAASCLTVAYGVALYFLIPPAQKPVRVPVKRRRPE